MNPIAQPPKDPIYSDAMIAVDPSIPLNLDCCIAPPFTVRKGSAAEQSPAVVSITAPYPAPYNVCPEGIYNKATGFIDVSVPMPDSLSGFVQNNFGDARMVVIVYGYDDVPYKAFEMFQPVQTGPKAFTCQTGAWHYLPKDSFIQTLYTPGGGSGAGLSLAKYNLRPADLDSKVPHPLLCTLPPKFFGLQDNAAGINDSYCCGIATMILQASRAEGAQRGNAAFGNGATFYLKGRDVSGFTADAQYVLQCLMTSGLILCDRGSAGFYKLDVVAERNSPRLLAVAAELAGKFHLGDFYVGKMTRYNYHTKPNQYPAF